MSNQISPGLWNLTVFALCSAGSMHEFTSYWIKKEKNTDV